MRSTPFPRPWRRFAPALIVAAALILTGCSGGSDDGAPASAELGDTGAELETVRVGLAASLANLYIGQEGGINNYWVAANVQEGLLGIDADGKLVPALASSWEQTDATTYVFTLRDDAKFQNGDPVTADDVVFSLNAAADPTLSPSTASYLYTFDSATASGSREVTVRTTEPDAAFLTTLTNAGSLVVTQQQFWDKYGGAIGTSDSLLLGTGPYKVTEFQPDSHVILDRVDTWWGGLPKVKQIRIDFIPDENTRLLAAQNGDLDVALSVPLKQLPQWEELSGGRVESVDDLSYTGLFFDLSVPPFDDPKVREAVASAMDRETIVDKVLRGNGEVANTIMSPPSLAAAYGGDQARDLLMRVPAHDFDLARAKELLAESTEADGFETTITYPSAGSQLGTAAQALAENLKQLGITLRVREVPTEEWLATIGDGQHGLGFMWYFSTTGDPAEISSYLLGEGNPSHIADADALELISKAGAATEPAARIDLLVELETLNAENTYAAPLWWGRSLTFFSDAVGVRTFTPYTFIGPWGNQLFAAAQ